MNYNLTSMKNYGEKMKLSTEFYDIVEDINQSIYVILATRKGEKIFEPDFGCSIWDLLDTGVENVSQIISAIVNSIKKWEQRIDLEDVKIERFDNSDLLVQISYRLRGRDEKGIFRTNLFEANLE